MDVGQLASAGFSTIANTIVGLDNQKKQAELNRYLAKLNQEQKIAIEKKMIEAKTQVERQRVLFQLMALEKNNDLIKETSKDKTTSIIVLSVGIVIFGALIFISRKRNG